MRKIISLFLAAIMCACLLSGCGEKLTPPVADHSGTDPVSTTTTASSNTTNTSASTETTTTTTTQPQLSAAQQSLLDAQKKIAQSGELMGVAYLGYCEGSYAQVREYISSQPYASECLYLDLVTGDRFVSVEGAELYVVIPAGDEITLTVNEYSWMDENGEYAPAPGKELLTSGDGSPILLQCNISDIMSNLRITAENDSGKSAAYNPCLSLEDGMLDMLSGGICDLTPYDHIPQFDFADPVPDYVFCGTWFCEAYDGNDDLRSMILTLEPDGGVSYSYGIGNSEILESFTGTWTNDGQLLTLDMCGGPVGTGDDDYSAAEYAVTVYLEWHSVFEGLKLTHVTGDVLLHGTVNDTFIFSSMF